MNSEFHKMILNTWFHKSSEGIQYDRVNFEKVEQWFFINGITDPRDAAEKWAHWITKEYPKGIERPATLQKKIFILALGICEAMYRHYFHDKYERQKLVPQDTRKKLDFLMRFTGHTPPPFQERRVAPNEGGRDYHPPLRRKKIALISELNNLPSLPYHKEVINGIVIEAEKHKYDLAIHEAIPGNPDEAIKRAILTNLPDGIILVRLKPSKEFMSKLKASPIPMVLIHSGERLAEYPVVGNIESVLDIARGSELRLHFNEWIRNLTEGRDQKKQVIIVHMPIAGDNHRKKRVRHLATLLKEEQLQAGYHEVENYGFEHAYSVWKSYPNASAYLCLSDQIAVGLKNILQAKHQYTHHNVVGFDGSPLARKEKIYSFDQKLETIGKLAVERLKKCIQTGEMPTNTEIPIRIEFFNPHPETTLSY